MPGKFLEKRYPLPPEIIAGAKDGRVIVKFLAPNGLAGGVFDVRLTNRRPPPQNRNLVAKV